MPFMYSLCFEITVTGGMAAFEFALLSYVRFDFREEAGLEYPG